MNELRVTHIGGMYPVRRPMRIRINTDGVTFLLDKKKVVATFTWDQVDQLAWEDPKRTRASVGAILLVGALGLGARKDFTVIYFEAGDRSAVFEVGGMVLHWRGWVNDLIAEVPAAKGKAFIAPDQQGPAAPPPTDIPAQIKALAELHAQGVLTDEEFATKKADLLARM